MKSNLFTNQKSNTLKNKINNVLKINKNINYLDFLIGYFRITGFDKISDNLSNIEKTRILVGINTDKGTYQASQLINKFSQEQIEIYNREPLDIGEYQNFQSMRELIIENRIEVRISPNRDIHSKMYILRSEPLHNDNKDEITYLGSVIIGSSNLTHNGLEGNIEINAELNQERDIVEAVGIFEKLWSDSVELTEDDFSTFITPHIKAPPLTPHQLYIRLLIEHFGDRIDFIEDNDISVPEGYKRLTYQVEAMNEGIDKLQKHNGFFLSDVVGLGKTVVVAMIIKKLESSLKKRVLVVIPPAVRTQWQDTLNEFEIKEYDIISLAKLKSVESDMYELIVVDESHKFKNSKSKRYRELYDICKNKKVILLSATPQNNTPNDMYNQIALFQNVKNSTVANFKNIQSFFSQREKRFREIIGSEPIDNSSLDKLSIEIRDSILKSLIIRRTRYDIQKHKMYKDDIKANGLSIPKVNIPKEYEYKLEGELETLFDNTAIEITKNLKYSRFNLLYYLTKEGQKRHYPNESDNIFSKNPLAGLMKTILVKRFESSFYAFKISIGRHLKRYEKFLKNFEDDIIYLGESATDILDYDEDSGYDEFIEKLIDAKKVKIAKRSDFKKSFKSDLESDFKILQTLIESWKDIEVDPKLDKFREVLKEDRGKKIVIFTESVDTLNYLKQRLSDNNNILFITSHNRDKKKQIIKENFDANYSDQKDDYNIIITTDTLAEGINLHRSSIIYNYDIPWNATKLIQRIGRVNRIGTKATHIDIHNFKPASHIETLIKLSQKAFVKLQSSHTMIGEDSQIYTKDEVVSSVELFEGYQKESIERDEELGYLEELREFRESNPKEFKYIKELEAPLSLEIKSDRDGAYILLDIDGEKNYLYIGNDIRAISFVEMVEVFRSNLDKVYKEKNQEEIILRVKDYFGKKRREEKRDRAEGRADEPMEQKAQNLLKEWLKRKIISRDELKEYRASIINGDIGSIEIENIYKLENKRDETIAQELKDIMVKHIEVEKYSRDDSIKINLVEYFSN